jgi:hypothetical protein
MGYPRCRVALAVVPDPPHRRPTLKSGQTPPLCPDADRSPVLTGDRQSGKISRVVSIPSGRTDSVQSGHRGPRDTVTAGHVALC